MTKIFLLLNESEEKAQIKQILENAKIEQKDFDGNFEEIFSDIYDYNPDIILVDNRIETPEFTIRQIKASVKNQNTQFILLFDDTIGGEFVNLVDGVLELPIRENVVLTSINSHLKIKKSLDRLYENNKELSRSLYQLNVLYNTSSQFAGTLNTNKLYEIMIEAMEKTLSFDISAVLLFSTDGKPVFNLNTILTPAQNLIDALKIRSILNYRTMFEDNALLRTEEFDEVKVVQKTKQSRSNKILNLDAISYDSLFAPIKVGDSFFGVIELFRQIPFSTEDVTCFQAITHQVALPLRSAKLYEEISITNKKLEKLEKLKSEFVSIVSHELRTPLTPINNSLEIVLNEQAGPISSDAKNFISMAKRNIQRLSGIIEDLLDLSRIQAGKMDFKYKIVDVSSSLELLAKTFLQVANEKNITITLDIEQKLPQIYADIRRVEQILSNLVSNSLKFTQSGGFINVSAKVVSADEINFDDLIMPTIKLNGEYIKISVKDDGIGMKKEDIPKIFDKFSQIESSLNRNKGGVGLGLTITKQLIDSHLGGIWVDSKEKEGSTFNVILPLLDDKKMFEMDLSHALTNNNEVGAIKIKSKKELNLIQNLKENKILNLSDSSKEVIVDDLEETEFFAFVPKISFESFNALVTKIDEYCKKINNQGCDIILSSAHSAKYGLDANNIIKVLNN